MHMHGHHGGDHDAATDETPETSPTLRLFVSPILCTIGLAVGWSLEYFSQQAVSSESPTNPLRLLSFLAYSLAYLAGGVPILWLTWKSGTAGFLNIDFLMFLAASGSALLGEFADGAVLLLLFSLSHALEGFILGRTRNAIRRLMDLSPDEATVLTDGREQVVAVEHVPIGATILVRPGERIPLDGVVSDGRSSVDESMVTGESIPIDKEPLSQVLSGTVNLNGVLKVKVQRLVQESTLARMVKLVESAQSRRATAQQFTEWFDHRYPWVVLGLTAVTFAGSLIAGNPLLHSFLHAVTVLVVASPCAVVISIPAAILTAIARAARSGVLFKGGLTVEQLARVNAIAFDKTGTLTAGKPQVVEFATADGVTDAELLSAAAGLEQDSEHPLAKALRLWAKNAGITNPIVTDLLVVAGNGVTGIIDSRLFRAGKVRWLASEVATPPSRLQQTIENYQHAGYTLVGITRESEWLGVIAVADTVRATSADAIAEIRRMGVTTLIILTGDHTTAAARIAAQLEIQFQAELLPEQKLDFLDRWQQSGLTTAMVGDGMNDAPALARADVGVSLGGAGTDVALETADVIIMADDLRRLPYAIRLARKTQIVIRQNLTIAFLTMAGLLISMFFVSIPLSLAVLGHEGSTVIVILNGLRLLRVR